MRKVSQNRWSSSEKPQTSVVVLVPENLEKKNGQFPMQITNVGIYDEHKCYENNCH